MRSLLTALIGGVCFTSQVWAQKFDGVLEFEPAGCEAQGACSLKYNFGFIDRSGKGWLAAAGDRTDGASIPDWAQPYVGKPFETAYIKAAVVHDHYCNRRVRGWRETHRVFYEALRASGVENGTALIMYYAVLVGGPKWFELDTPLPCQLGKNCIFQVETAILPADGKLLQLDKKRFYSRPARYHEKAVRDEIGATSRLIQAQNSKVTLDELDKRAKAFRPGDVFYSTGEKIRAGTVILAPIE